MNKLPEKLTLLRKYNNLSQGDMATKLNIPVTEYMQWENGNRIPPVSVIANIAELFGITVDLLLDNTQTIVFPEKKLEASATIPFNSGSDINATQVFDDSMQETIQTASMDLDDQQASYEDEEEAGHTKVMNKDDLNDDDEDVEEEKPIKKVIKKKKAPLSKRKKTAFIITGVAAVVVIIAIVILLFRTASSSLKVGTENRLALGTTYSLYVDNNGNVKKHGDLSSPPSSAVQVSAFDEHALYLDSNGNVTSTISSLDLSEFKDVSSIAAGKDHAIGVTDEGKVVCSGNDDACKVTNWTNVSSVYAGNGFSVALTNDGEMKVSGNNTDAISSETNVRSVSISDTLIVLTKKDGTVKVYPIGSSTTVDTSGWSDIQSTACGNNLVVGLKKDGTVEVASDNEEITTAVTSWKNIKHLAANGSTVVGINSNGKMVGAGDNTYSQYVNETDDSTNSEEGQLDDVKNIQVTVTTGNITIKWDTVENADYYEVEVEGVTSSPTKTTSNSTSIPASSLEDGKTYTITVTAKSNDEDKYKESTGTLEYQYTAKTTQLATPNNITASSDDNGDWTIQWSAVEHADSYMVSIGGGSEFPVNTNSYTVTAMGDEGTYSVSIRACSSNSSYSESETATVNLQYQTPHYTVVLNYYVGNDFKGTSTINISAGTYTYSDLDTAAGSPAGASYNTTLVSPTDTVTINKSKADGQGNVPVTIYLN